jgi:hypothetical protein
MFADMSGFNHWPRNATDDELLELIKERIVTQDTEDSCYAEALNLLHQNVPIHDCACCGKKIILELTSLHNTGLYDLNNPDHLAFVNVLRMDKDFSGQSDESVVYKIIFDKFQKMASDNESQYLQSFNHYTFNSVRYAMHPDLVDKKSQKFRLCQECVSKLGKSKIPEYAIRNGYDFGNYQRAGLPELSDIAKAILGQESGFGAKIIKLQETTNTITEANLNHAITGHFVVFASNLIPNQQCSHKTLANNEEEFIDRIKDSIHVSFVGTIPNWHIVRRELKNKNCRLLSKIFQVKVDDIQQWIKYLRFRERVLDSVDQLNRMGTISFLRNLLYLDEQCTLFSNQGKLNSLVDDILENCQVCDNDTAKVLERIATANVTDKVELKQMNILPGQEVFQAEEVVVEYIQEITNFSIPMETESSFSPPTPTPPPPPPSPVLSHAFCEPMETDELSPSYIPLQHVSHSNVTEESQSSVTLSVLKERIQTLKQVDALSSKDLAAGVFIDNLSMNASPVPKFIAALYDAVNNQNPPHFLKKRLQDPYNEFQNNKELLLGLFFYLFTLGIGVMKSGTMTDGYVKHLLDQYNGRFSSNEIFVFLAFNQYIRHCQIRSASTKIDNNLESSEKFSKWVKDDNFKAKLQTAFQNPDSKEAKEIACEVYPVLNMSSTIVPRCGPEHQKTVISNLFNYIRFFDLPCIFLTISPNDAENVIGLKLCISAQDKRNGKYFEKSRDEMLINVDLNTEERIKLIRNNPHFYAKAFKRMLTAVFKFLVGLDFEENIKKNVESSQRKSGVFGKIAAHFTVVETQGRGTLHSHSELFGGSLNPYILQRAAITETLRDEMGKLIDSMIKAEVPIGAAEADVKRRLLGQPTTRHILQNPTSEKRIISYLYNPDDYKQSKDYGKGLVGNLQTKAEESICGTNLHQHGDACKKGKIGVKQCRMAFPQTIVPKTRPVSLQMSTTPFVDSSTKEKNGFLESLKNIYSKEQKEKLKNHQQKAVAKTDKEGNIIPPSSAKEVSYWELSRQKLYLSEDSKVYDLLKSTLKPGDDFESHKIFLQDKFLTYNTNMVEYNRTLLTTAFCNQSVQLLGSTGQATSAAMYCVDYMAKRETGTAKTLGILSQAFTDIQNHPSKAVDTTEESKQKRAAKHVLQRYLNKIVGKDEISAPMAAYVVGGESTSLSSHKGKYVNTWGALKAILANRNIQLNVEEPEEINTDSDLKDQQKEGTMDLQMQIEYAQKESVENVHDTDELNVEEETDDEEEFEQLEQLEQLDEPSEIENEGDEVKENDQKDPIESPTSEEDDKMGDNEANPRIQADGVLNPEVNENNVTTVEQNDYDLTNGLEDFYDDSDPLSKNYYKTYSYRVNNETIYLDQWIHYFYRGIELEALSFFEYFGIIDVVSKAKSKSKNKRQSCIRIINDPNEIKVSRIIEAEAEEEEREITANQTEDIIQNQEMNDEDEDDDEDEEEEEEEEEKEEVIVEEGDMGKSDGAGRKANKRFDFSEFHPLKDTHQQRLKSKQNVPFLGGNNPPQFSHEFTEMIFKPRDRIQKFNIKMKKKVNTWSAYYSVLMIPWKLPITKSEILYGPDTNLSFESFLDWWHKAVTANIDKFLRHYVKHCTCCFMVTHIERMLYSSYRRKNATKWCEKPPPSFPDNKDQQQAKENLLNEVESTTKYIYERKATSDKSEMRVLEEFKYFQHLSESFQYPTDVALKQIPHSLISQIKLATFAKGFETLTKFSITNVVDHVNLNVLQQRKNLLLHYRTQFTASNICDDINELQTRLSCIMKGKDGKAITYNKEQIRIISEILQNFEDYLDISKALVENNLPKDNTIHKEYKQILKLIHGGPGTGKSTVISAIKDYMYAKAEFDIPRIAITGSAATVIDGGTYHSFLKLNVRYGKKQDENSTTLGTITNIFSKLRTCPMIIVDEVSMFGVSQFLTLHKTLQKVFIPLNLLEVVVLFYLVISISFFLFRDVV